ncbi:MAG: hypothetical protein BLM47_12235 [Candidatus Reconcilbacillus cellulovorans]|uniref:DNA-binding response regulator n=1 Tax=Candidatus Reconcilbacillus cellulovorans TaxID=1906605 RepID=A0A2A6DXS3_9BACL|nr:MAG: hypothetical protein BLM47_12235 [Candidatus Reconcilbacillus cellulovorans]
MIKKRNDSYGVLLVDDEPLAIQGLLMMIDWEKCGFRVLGSCENGEDAFCWIEQLSPEVVVTDIRMPAVDGLELIERTRRAGNDRTRFVIVSGYGEFQYAKRALELGVRDFWMKPVLSSEAEATLAKIRSELDRQTEAGLIRDYAERYALGYALSILLYDPGAVSDFSALEPLARLSGRAKGWAYILVETDAGETDKAREAAERLAEETGRCPLIERDRRSFGLIYGAENGEEDEVRVFSRRLYERVRGAVNGTVGIAVGSVTQSLETVSRSYSHALEASRFLFFGREELIHYSDVKHSSLVFGAGLLQASDAIVELVEGDDAETLVKAVRELFQNFMKEMTHPKLVGILSIQVALRCAGVFKEWGGNPNALLMDTGWDEFDFHSRRLSEIENFLTSFCLKCQSGISELKRRRSGGTVIQVAEYLRLHYREPVTVREIAGRFYVNPVYLGQQFMRKFGMGILDYVHHLRIEEAKRLLRETDLPAAFVAESVGYDCYPHFLKQFKKHTGTIPSDYRAGTRPIGTKR